ncbi:MAG: hypothetical protein GY909_00390 [Oligoflexia bacterium]|nr:hypothetical protein [Oligoflexia bacterium]
MDKILNFYGQTLPLIKKKFLSVIIFVIAMSIFYYFDHDLTSEIVNNPKSGVFIPLLFLYLGEIFAIVFLYCAFLGKLNRLPIYFLSYFIRYLGFILKTAFGFLLFIYPGVKWGVGEFFSPELSIFQEDSEKTGPEMSLEILENNFQEKLLNVVAIVAPQFFCFLLFWVLRLNFGESEWHRILSNIGMSITLVFTISYTYIFLHKAYVKKV